VIGDCKRSMEKSKTGRSRRQGIVCSLDYGRLMGVPIHHGFYHAGIFRGSILTTLPSRSTATLFPARRCMSTAFFTAALTALLIAALSEKVSVRLRLREVFLVMAFP
jgi:hypothetical protein